MPGPALWDLNFPADLHRWLDLLPARARAQWRSKEGLDDDTIPSICPRFGIAEHSAFVAAAVAG